VRRLPLLAGIGMGFALFRELVRRRRARSAAPEATDPRALELRRKLDDARAAEPSAAPAAAAPTDLDARRQDVHDRGRAALDRMRGHDDPT
jgi:hypothetical protein